MKISKNMQTLLMLMDIGVGLISALLVIGGFLKGFGIFGMKFISELSFPLFVILLSLLLIRVLFFIIFKDVSSFPFFLKTGKKGDDYKPFYIGIFLTSVSVLMLEILLTRIY